MKDTEYYNKESTQYSRKRYPDVSTDYRHFFFKKRLSLLLTILDSISRENKKTLLEIGCADGVVLLEVDKRNYGFTEMLGTDVSPEMITAAIKNTKSNRISYFVRGEKDLSGKMFDVIVEIGVLNFTDLYEDLDFAREHLDNGGYYICSVASRTSLISKLKPENKKDYRHFMTFSEYEAEFKKRFSVVASAPYGFFVPFLWRLPAVARIVQPIVEFLFRHIFSEIFHEKIYLLKKK